MLQDQVELAGEDSEAITLYLENWVENMIRTANNRASAGREAVLPLIRLRVSFRLCMSALCAESADMNLAGTLA